MRLNATSVFISALLPKFRPGLSTTSCPRGLRLLVLSLMMTLSSSTFALLQIDIVKGVDIGISIAIVPFAWQGTGQPPQTVSEVVEADLSRSGRFEPLSKRDYLSLPSEGHEVQFKDWRLIKAEALVIGKVRQTGGDEFRVEFQLFDVFQGVQLAAFGWSASAHELRGVAHQISDLVYEKLLGERGAFNTQIAYVTVERAASGNTYYLKIADSDGYSPQTILKSRESILSPAWSPDGSQLAYVSFESRRSVLWIQNKSTGARRKLAEFKGINSAPDWAPDGRRIAMTLSRDGNTEIYIMDVDGGNVRRLTNNPAIDTEPSWAPDGQSLVFSSGRSGRPQIYRISVNGGKAQRLTFDGKQNSNASFSPDGRSLVLITNQGGSDQVGILDLNTNAIKVLTNSRLNESPSFAPNGGMILYATKSGGQDVLAAISFDGKVKQVLKFQKGGVREPAWSPYTNAQTHFN